MCCSTQTRRNGNTPSEYAVIENYPIEFPLRDAVFVATGMVVERKEGTAHERDGGGRRLLSGGGGGRRERATGCGELGGIKPLLGRELSNRAFFSHTI